MSPDLKHGNPGSPSILKYCETRLGRPSLGSQGLPSTGARTRGGATYLNRWPRSKAILCLLLTKGRTTLAFLLEICLLSALAFEG